MTILKVEEAKAMFNAIDEAKANKDFKEAQPKKKRTRYRIVSLKYPPYAATADEMYAMLGLMKQRLPDEGLEPRHIQGVLVWVEPKANKPQFIRTLCSCPGCGRTLSVKCLDQHLCDEPVSETWLAAHRPA
jgi:hypothetical protein